MRYVVVYTEDGSVVAAAPVDGDRPVVSDGERTLEVDLEEQPNFDKLRFDSATETLVARGE